MKKTAIFLALSCVGCSVDTTRVLVDAGIDVSDANQHIDVSTPILLDSGFIPEEPGFEQSGVPCVRYYGTAILEVTKRVR